MGVKSTDFWHKLNATRQTKCKSLAYIAFNLPIVAFTLSGDPFFVPEFRLRRVSRTS